MAILLYTILVLAIAILVALLLFIASKSIQSLRAIHPALKQSVEECDAALESTRDTMERIDRQNSIEIQVLDIKRHIDEVNTENREKPV